MVGKIPRAMWNEIKEEQIINENRLLNPN